MSNQAQVPDVTEAIERIGRPVAERIDTLLSAEIERWCRLDENLCEPLERLRALVLAGGKRLRPAFAYWAFIAAGGDKANETIVDAGAALELLHSFALIHDDVMDDSRQRRGEEAVHTYFERVHAERGWRGEHRRFGEGVAILVGDMAFVYADLLMNGAGPEALDVFTELRIELNIGQYLDLSATTRHDASLPMAQKIAQYKSGKYTVERPMHLGAALAGKFEELSVPFSDYGIPVGEAFQLRDDLLGAFGEAEVTGKPAAGDLREGKPTALLALAYERATGADAELLAKRYGYSDISDDEIAEMQRIFTDTGARSELENTIDQLIADGLKALESVEIVDEARTCLVDLAYFVAGRHH